MRNEENPRAGGSETGDACRQKKWREFLKKVPPIIGKTKCERCKKRNVKIRV